MRGIAGRRAFIGWMALGALGSAPLRGANLTEVTVDLGAHQWTGCDGVGAAGLSAGACLVKVREGTTVALLVKNALPGLFTYEPRLVDHPRQEVDAAAAKIFGLVPTPSQAVAAKLDEPSVAQLYNDVVEAHQQFQAYLNGKVEAQGYKHKLQRLGDTRQRLLDKLDLPDDPDAVAGAVKARVEAQVPHAVVSADGIAARWLAVGALLDNAPPEPTTLGPWLYIYKDHDFDVILEAKPTSVVSAVARSAGLAVRGKYGWKISSTAGFSFSGLVDDHYSTRTVVDEPAVGDTPAVTHAEAVMESRDGFRAEPSVFLHVSPFHDSPLEHLAVTTGVSLNSSGAGRIYAGLSWRLGQVGALTVGAAAGSAKRLSRNVDPGNLGTTDPEQSRRDVFMSRLFVAFSLRVAGGS